uniref:Fructan:fructan 6G-fructosyltransferase n=1 Tax=Agave tequilana TaxID=386106 RepID=I1ZBQ6_AGATE|nr:fructan:fructan 6G-fructosyltransferase [Agave tequilana]
MGSPDLYNPIAGSRPPLRTLRLLSLALSAALLLALVAVASFLNVKSGSGLDSGSGSDQDEFPWTKRMLTWQRAGFHFRTVKNYMTDPCGPMYHKGWYHLFYQHNPNYSFWDYTMSWGHAVSRDLLNWYHLPVAIQPDHWYDVWGDWTGSIMRLSDGRIVLLYTGITGRKEAKRQVINVATADDPSDPLLLRWSKYEGNPVLLSPPGIEREDFRDPSPFWYNSSDSTWYLVFGSRNESLNHAGIALVYTTRDFISFNLLPHYLHFVEEIGMWECVELYPVAAAGPSANRGLDPFVMPGENVKHVLKSSVNDEWHDYYAIGTFDTGTMTWTPDDETVDVGMGMRYDWGKFYASRTFYDQMKQRRILWGYVGETDSQNADIQKGWASFQALPREVLFDLKTGSNLLTWPVEEVKSLRMRSRNFSNIVVGKGSTVELDIGDANQLDIEVEFEINKEDLEAATVADVAYNCTSGSAAARGPLGPFGLLVLANRDLTEQTATYFYVSREADGSVRTHFCQDELRSTKAKNIVKRVVGNTFPVLTGETLSVRTLVDHSIVESFAQGGRTSTTSRAYPTEAIYEDARVFLFNNATGATVTAKSVKIWHMNSTVNELYQFPSFQAHSGDDSQLHIA